MYRLVMVLGLVLNVDGCHFKDAPSPAPVPPPMSTTNIAPDTEASCLAAGGHWAFGGLSRQQLCFLPNADAGKSCKRASDCDGVCLSETHACAPERPLFGCYGYLDEAGRERMICRD